MPRYILFYNGPQCGASAPDHIHFQAIEKGQLPLEKEWQLQEKEIWEENNDSKVEQLLTTDENVFTFNRHAQTPSLESLKVCTISSKKRQTQTMNPK
jgi:lipoate-protein ligase B